MKKHLLTTPLFLLIFLASCGAIPTEVVEPPTVPASVVSTTSVQEPTQAPDPTSTVESDPNNIPPSEGACVPLDLQYAGVLTATGDEFFLVVIENNEMDHTHFIQSPGEIRGDDRTYVVQRGEGVTVCSDVFSVWMFEDQYSRSVWMLYPQWKFFLGTDENIEFEKKGE